MAPGKLQQIITLLTSASEKIEEMAEVLESTANPSDLLEALEVDIYLLEDMLEELKEYL